jgi:hypothetical protein
MYDSKILAREMVLATSTSAYQQTTSAAEARFLPEGQTLNTEKSLIHRTGTPNPTAFKRGHSLEQVNLDKEYLVDNNSN